MQSVLRTMIKLLHQHYRFLMLILTPIVLMPLPIVSKSQPALAGYGIAVMAVYWIFEVTPIPVTSLLPLLIFPLLGVLPAKDVCMEYMTDTNVLLLGGLLIAVAIEEWDVHRRIALGVLLLVGAQPRRLLLGFMLVTAFISMWITNTATTAMMTPIVEAVLKQLDQQYLKDFVDEDEEDGEENGNISAASVGQMEGSSAERLNEDVELQGLNSEKGGEIIVASSIRHFGTCQDLVKSELESRHADRHKWFSKSMLLCICYAASIGGTATLTGSAPQLVFKGQVKAKFPNGPAVSFFYWFVFAFPTMLVLLFLGWLYLQFHFMGISWKHLCFCFRLKKRNKEKGKEAYAIMQKQYRDLGPVSYAEVTVILMFVLLVLLWFFREPQFIPGWGDFFKKNYISDGTAAMVIGFLLFQLPSQMPDIPFIYKNKERVKLKSKRILNWKPTQEKLAWDVLLLLGAGFALAKACEGEIECGREGVMVEFAESPAAGGNPGIGTILCVSCLVMSKSGLSVWLSCKMTGLVAIKPWIVVLVVSTLMTFLTEITSNTATATILLPVLASLAQSIRVNPLYLMVPATICSSFAFMLPVATPPNAIVFGTGRLTVPDMAKAGFGMNILGILVITLAINTWGSAYYGLAEFPQWAAGRNVTTSC